MRVFDIMSIVKHNGKYRIYFPNIVPKSGLFEDKICKWWGVYDTFDNCFNQLLIKNEYKHLEIDKSLLRNLKLDKIKDIMRKGKKFSEERKK